MLSAPDILHATLVARWIGGRWRGALIRGASGAGKSTLALRSLEGGFRLVADDRVMVWRSGDTVYGKAPAPLAGLIEVRAVGVIPVQAPLPMAAIDLVVDLAPTAERLPDPTSIAIAGMQRPHLILLADDPHTPLRLAAALAATQHRL